MGPIAKLRLANLAFMLMVMFTIGSLVAHLLNFTLTLKDKGSGEVTVTTVAAATWYQEHLFGLTPQLGMIFGMLGMMGLAVLYTALHVRTDPAVITESNKAVELWVQRNWWKVLIVLLVLSFITAEVTVRWFPL